ncbi:hypothetical protein KCV06_g128, partial [Aureobasidium melanogenum]
LDSLVVGFIIGVCFLLDLVLDLAIEGSRSRRFDLYQRLFRSRIENNFNTSMRDPKLYLKGRRMRESSPRTGGGVRTLMMKCACDSVSVYEDCCMRAGSIVLHASSRKRKECLYDQRREKSRNDTSDLHPCSPFFFPPREHSLLRSLPPLLSGEELRRWPWGRASMRHLDAKRHPGTIHCLTPDRVFGMSAYISVASNDTVALGMSCPQCSLVAISGLRRPGMPNEKLGNILIYMRRQYWRPD